MNHVEFGLRGPQMKYFRLVLQSLCKTGASELLLEAFSDSLVLRSINTSRSAYLAVTLSSTFFHEYCLVGPVLQTAVLLKHALVLVAGTHSSRVSVHVANGGEKLSGHVWGENGLKKSFQIVCLGADVLNANVCHEDYPVSILVNSWSLQKLLSSFQSGQDELTIICTPASPDKAGSCLLKTFHDPSGQREIRSSLRTELCFDAETLLLAYEHSGESPIDVTFNVQDFKAAVYLCCQVGADVCVKLHSPGKPLIVEPRWPAVRVRREIALDGALEATLVLATLATSQVARCETRPSNACNRGNNEPGESWESLPSNPDVVGISTQNVGNGQATDQPIHSGSAAHGLGSGDLDEYVLQSHSDIGEGVSPATNPEWDRPWWDSFKESVDIDENVQQTRAKRQCTDTAVRSFTDGYDMDQKEYSSQEF